MNRFSISFSARSAAARDAYGPNASAIAFLEIRLVTYARGYWFSRTNRMQNGAYSRIRFRVRSSPKCAAVASYSVSSDSNSDPVSVNSMRATLLLRFSRRVAPAAGISIRRARLCRFTVRAR